MYNFQNKVSSEQLLVFSCSFVCFYAVEGKLTKTECDIS